MAIARANWERAGLTDKITMHLGTAVEFLKELPSTETFDFAFIDADKENYRAYYEAILPRMPSGASSFSTTRSGTASSSIRTTITSKRWPSARSLTSCRPTGASRPSCFPFSMA
jgi:hypothetical protein